MPLQQSAKKELDNLVGIRTLKTVTPDADKIQGFIRSSESLIRDAQIESLGLRGRFSLIYDAAHSLALAALHFHGYKPENRYSVFQTLQQTLQVPSTHIKVLIQAHAKRNAVEYEGDSSIESSLVESLVRVTRDLEVRVKALVQNADSPE